MDTFYKNTVAFLKRKGKTPKDIVWVGSEDLEISWKNFKILSKRDEYDCFDVAEDLVIVGDGWWADRQWIGEDDDLEEMWVLHESPARPSKKVFAIAIPKSQAEEYNHSLKELDTDDFKSIHKFSRGNL